MDHKGIRLGYACINTELEKFNVLTSRTLKLKTANERGIDYITRLATENVSDLLKILIFNEAHGIRFYRITSCLFPHLGNPKLQGSNYGMDFVKEQLKNIGQFATAHGHRLTMHPGQFVQLGSPNEHVVAQSIVDLINHAQIFKYMKLKPSDGSVLIIHGGGTFGDRQQALNRWRDNFNKLPEDVRQYIVLENDENSYGVDHLLPFCEELGIPFCLDIFHNKISKDRVPITKKLIRRIFGTWNRRGIVPKMHVSEQQPGLKRGAHSKTMDRIPLYLLRLPSMFNTALDIMLEVKDKQESVFRIYCKYFDIKMDCSGRVSYALKEEVVRQMHEPE
jgi:UV DNA damage endonuclease